MRPGQRRTRAEDYAWQHVRRVGPALGLTLLGLCRVLDTEGFLEPVEPQKVAQLTGKADITTARDLHALASRQVIVRTLIRKDGSNVTYTVPREVVAAMLGLQP